MPLPPLRARWAAGEGPPKKVTWLELFFDLVFVAAVAQVASPLHHHYTADGLFRFVVLFVLIWWAWVGHATFATRFEGDVTVQRALTLLQMFLVAVMAANATDALDSRSSAGFAAAYAAMRFLLVFQYYRARRVPQAESLSARHLAGHGIAGVLWLASALVPAPIRFVVWAVALLIDLGTPWTTVGHTVTAPPDAEHLPERVGLFTIILLGESVIAVMHGMESQEHWSVPAASAAFLGMGMTFLLWWAYFERVDAAGARRVACRRSAVRFHLWTYAHLPLYVGMIVSAVGVQRIIEHDVGSGLPPAEFALLGTGVLCVAAGLALLWRMRDGRKGAFEYERLRTDRTPAAA
jgi:low temperature requirement protein LtrA